MPIIQSVHNILVIVLFHLPEAQATHASALEARPYPASQKHTPWGPLLELRPVVAPDDTYPTVAVQAVHTVFDAVLAVYVPAGQGRQAARPTVLYLPAAQGKQDVEEASQ